MSPVVLFQSQYAFGYLVYFVLLVTAVNPYTDTQAKTDTGITSESPVTDATASPGHAAGPVSTPQTTVHVPGTPLPFWFWFLFSLY